MKETIKEVLASKRLIVNKYTIEVSFNNNLSLSEFLVLVYLDNGYSKTFEVETISADLGIDAPTVMEVFNSLMIKGLVSLDSTLDYAKRYNEVINLDGFYNQVHESIVNKNKKETSENIFKVFEAELGRTISPMELELINGWLNSGINEELILEALREAIYNGVSNFRYIDKIIYEWDKKGYKTKDDIKKSLKNRREEKDKKSVVSKKEQEILDYDWLDAE